MAHNPGHSFVRDFALDVQAASVLGSLQMELVDRDIAVTRLQKNNKRRVHWEKEWVGVVRAGFQAMQTTPKPTLWGRNDPELLREVENLRCAPDRLKVGLVLLELATFDAYWPMEKCQKEFKGLSLDKGTHKEFLRSASTRLGFPETRAMELRDEVRTALRSISGYNVKLAIGVLAGLGLGALTLGLAAPFIGGLVGGAVGLHGAAAMTYGLAALGGGAVAAGGYGMAGGTVALVGGGAILGLGAGGTVGWAAAGMTAESTLLSAAKLEVVLKEFILHGQKDIGKVQEILLAQRRSIQALEEELDKLNSASEKSDDRIKVLESSINILRKALERNQGLLR